MDSSNGNPVNQLENQPNLQQKSNKGLICLTIVSLILAVAGVGFGVYAMMNKNKSEGTPTPEPVATEDPMTVKDAEVKALVAEFKEIAKSMFSNDVIKDTDVRVAAKNDTLKTRTLTEKGYGFEVEGYGDLDKAYELTEKYGKKLEASGFVEDAVSFFGVADYYNKETGIVCRMTSGMPNVFGCGYSKWIKDETIALANELAEAYKVKEGSYPVYLNVSNVKIKDSSVSPYQTLQVSFENAAALFYRVSKDAEWKFFRAAQAPADCSDYNTEDLKKAYAGDGCYVGNELRTVEQ